MTLSVLVFSYSSLERNLYLHSVITSIGIVDDEIPSDFQIPRRLKNLSTGSQ